MTDPSITRPSLLVRIRDASDGEGWSQFVEIYAPLVYGFVRRHGLQDADAADGTQDVLRAVARSARGLNYDPARGSFRGWLFTIVRNELSDFFKRSRKPGHGSGDTAEQDRINALPDSAIDVSTLWDQEHERRLFAWAAERVQTEVQDSTWRAFWMTAVDGRSGKEVAESLGLTVAAVYLAKSRVMARLKEIVRELQVE